MSDDTRPEAPASEAVERLSVDDLRTLFLFESLDDEQLRWLSERSTLEERPAGSVVYSEGEPATCLFVLLEGTVSLLRRVDDTDVEVNRTNQRGVYAGATRAYVPTLNDVYAGSFRAVTDSVTGQC
jgi:CRP-like cAMP-binding protein